MQKLGLKIAASLMIAVVISVVISAFRLNYLDAFFLDVRNYITSPKFQRDDIISIDISELKKKKENLAVEDLIESIRKISSWNPKLILLATKAVEVRDVDAIAELVQKTPRLYLYSKWGEDGSFSDSRLKDSSKSLVLKHTVDASLPPYDYKTRRFVLSMNTGRGYDTDLVKFNSVIPMFNVNEEFREGILTIYDTKQVNLRYYDRESVPEILLSKVHPADVVSKIVVLTTSDSYSGTIKHPYARFRYEEDRATSEYFSYGAYLLNVYANLKDREYVHEPSRAANIIWIFFFCFCNILLLALLQHSPKRYIILSFVVIPIEFIIGLAVFYFSGFNFDFSRIFVIQILLQYIGIPLILINYLRRSDIEKSEFQKKAEREKVKMKFSVKVAEAEMLMKIAAKVSHDLRSPIMALQIASEYLKGRVEPEVGSLIVESTARMRHIADDTLGVYRGKKVENSVPLVNVREVLAELIGSYCQIYPQLLFQITEEGFYGAQIPFYGLQRAVSNIFNNAIEAGATEIKIVIKSCNESIDVSISNNGPSIPDEVRKRLFQERATFGKSQGTGLGLYQVRKEIESYGGSVTLDSGEETAFIISLPKELKPFVIHLPGNVLVLERNSDLGALLSSVTTVRSFSSSTLSMAIEAVSQWQEAQTLILVDITFEDNEDTAFDFLELIKDRPFARVLLFSTVIDNTEVQKIADSYRVQLVEKWRLVNAIENLIKTRDTNL